MVKNALAMAHTSKFDYDENPEKCFLLDIFSYPLLLVHILPEKNEKALHTGVIAVSVVFLDVIHTERKIKESTNSLALLTY